MKGNIRIARVLGIPVVVNLSWLLTLAFVTAMLALNYFPQVLPQSSPYRDDNVLHWLMALASGVIFFASILVHELAHSIVARRQGIPVKEITLFIFGGVSQIGGEAVRPRHEFVMAIVGPITSVLLAGVFFVVWWLTGFSEGTPLALVAEWLMIINLFVAAFNMAPGFPMDGGRVLRSLIWGRTGNMFQATRLATLVGRGLGYALIMVGALAFLGAFDFIDPWSGAWFALLGFFLETSARQSWFQARALDTLGRFRADQIMSSELPTAMPGEHVGLLRSRGGRRFIFFVSDDDDRVVGVLTEREAGSVSPERDRNLTAGDLMVHPSSLSVAEPGEDGATMLKKMDTDGVWHLPVVAEGRVIGVVSKENLLRLIAGNLFRRQSLARPG